MGLKSIRECEERNLEKLLNYKLPHFWKKIGWGLFVVAMVCILSLKFFVGEFELLKDIIRQVILLSLFIVVLSKEEFEDERVHHLRARSFGMTFLLTALYILFQPLINFVVASALGKQMELFQDLGDFVILWFMLIMYLVFFYFSKKKQ
ncbi:hypothetical protein [Rasiella sp. SM2506]|uniref:hypothetical protein n=1 Tax=Rasiella sp. SM2506 TaxID=3423914 RepID=UPI003D79CD3F